MNSAKDPFERATELIPRHGVARFVTGLIKS